MVFDYENRTRKPVKFPMVKPGGFLSHFQARNGSGRRLPSVSFRARPGACSSSDRTPPRAACFIGLLRVSAACFGGCLCRDIPGQAKARHGAINGLCGGFDFGSVCRWSWRIAPYMPRVELRRVGVGWDVSTGAAACIGADRGKRKPPRYSPGRRD